MLGAAKLNYAGLTSVSTVLFRQATGFAAISFIFLFPETNHHTCQLGMRQTRIHAILRTMISTLPYLKQQFRSGLGRVSRSVASFSTYYDSQSGLHLPVHNEHEIKLFLNKSHEVTSTKSFIPAQFYKEDASSDIPDLLQKLKEEGVSGLWLAPAMFPRDTRNLETLENVAPEDFDFLISCPSKIPTPMSRVSILHEFAPDCDLDILQANLASSVEDGERTVLQVGPEACSTMEAISIANQIATLIDSTGGGNMLLLSPPSEFDEDDLVQICEELMYLDVAGPTIKSRLVIDSRNESILDESMMMGINKFVIEEETEVDLVGDIAKWQGKQIKQ